VAYPPNKDQAGNLTPVALERHYRSAIFMTSLLMRSRPVANIAAARDLAARWFAWTMELHQLRFDSQA